MCVWGGGLAMVKGKSVRVAISAFSLKKWHNLHLLAQKVAQYPPFRSKGGADSTFELKKGSRFESQSGWLALPRSGVERQLIMAELDDSFDLPKKLSDLPRLPLQRLRQDDREKLLIAGTERAAYRRRVRARRARSEEVVIGEDERVGEELDDLLVEEGAVPSPQNDDILRGALLNTLELLENCIH